MTQVGSTRIAIEPKIGLLPNVVRDSGNRRCYGSGDLSRLRFIRRAKRCDFSLDEIRRLLEFRGCRDTARRDVARLTEHKLDDIQRRLAELETLRDELQQLLHLCQGSKRGCPIIEGLDRSNRSGTPVLK